MNIEHFYEIIPAGTEYQPMLDLSQLAGWNQTSDQLRILTLKYPGSNLIAVGQYHNRQIPLGSGLVVDVGNSIAWIAMILVHPDFRRRGIASAIMKKCIQTARQQMKCNIIGLDATITGQQVYTNLGFKPSFRLWRCLAATNDVMNQKLNLEIAPIPELAHCYRLLDDIGIGHRACWLALVQSLNPDHCWSAKFRDEIVGLIISRPGRLKPFIGPLVAKSPDIARDLLYLVLAHWKHQGFEEVFIDIPEVHFKQASVWENEVNLALPSQCLLIQKLTISRPLVRMYQIIPDHGSKVAETDKNDEGIDVLNMLETKPDSTVVNQTIQYMVNEKASLKYLFATGGPELS